MTSIREKKIAESKIKCFDPQWMWVFVDIGWLDDATSGTQRDIQACSSDKFSYLCLSLFFKPTPVAITLYLVTKEKYFYSRTYTFICREVNMAVSLWNTHFQTLIKGNCLFAEKRTKRNKPEQKVCVRIIIINPPLVYLSLSIKIAWLIALLSCGNVKLKEF